MAVNLNTKILAHAEGAGNKIATYLAGMSHLLFFYVIFVLLEDQGLPEEVFS